MNEQIKNLGRLIRMRRLEKNLSTNQLHEKLGISSGLINNIENGKTDYFNLALMEKLCNELDISTLSFLKLDKKCFSEIVWPMVNFPNDVPHSINMIVEAYIQASIDLNHNSDKLRLMTQKILYEINFLSHNLR